jgi:hypothetical protein
MESHDEDDVPQQEDGKLASLTQKCGLRFLELWAADVENLENPNNAAGGNSRRTKALTAIVSTLAKEFSKEIKGDRLSSKWWVDKLKNIRNLAYKKQRENKAM